MPAAASGTRVRAVASGGVVMEGAADMNFSAGRKMPIVSGMAHQYIRNATSADEFVGSLGGDTPGRTRVLGRFPPIFNIFC